MAVRYWVGGSGTWDASSTTNWSASSGGASGASAPTSADDVIFDTNSGSGTVTLDTAGVSCKDFTYEYTVTTITFSGASSFGISSYGFFDMVAYNSTALNDTVVRIQGTGLDIGYQSFVGTLFINAACTLFSRIYARYMYVYAAINLDGGTAYVNGCQTGSSGTMTNGTVDCTGLSGYYSGFSFTTDMPGVTVAVRTSTATPSVSINPSNPSGAPNLTITNANTTTVADMRVNNLTISAGTTTLPSSSYAYGSISMTSAATVQSPGNSAGIQMAKVSGSPSVTRTLQVECTFTGSYDLNFTINAGTDLVNVNGTKFGSPVSGRIGDISIQSATTIYADNVYVSGFSVSPLIACDITGAVSFTTGGFSNYSTSFVQGSVAINILPSLASSASVFNGSTGTYGTINILPSAAQISFSASNACTINNLVMQTTVGGGNIVVKISGGATFNITGTWTLVGASPSDMIYMDNPAFGTTGTYTFSKSSGNVYAYYTSLRYCAATGGANFYALPGYGNIDNGNNTGWIFDEGGGNFLMLF